jgi:diadenosine tetraphosphate (Ap4A) HIT family hydrolase
MLEPMITLHPSLEKDTLFVADLPLSQLRLMNDARFPWLVLVPRREAMRDLVDLLPADQTQLLQEITGSCRALQQLYAPDKLNVAALGNMVPQLHVHVIARFKTDAAWPKPVWGNGTASPYEDAERTIAKLKNALNGA